MEKKIIKVDFEALDNVYKYMINKPYVEVKELVEALVKGIQKDEEVVPAPMEEVKEEVPLIEPEIVG